MLIYAHVCVSVKTSGPLPVTLRYACVYAHHKFSNKTGRDVHLIQHAAVVAPVL